MTIRYRYKDFKDEFDENGIDVAYSPSTARKDGKVYATSGNLNYWQNDYTDYGDHNCNITTKYTVEGDLCSLRWSADMYHRQGLGVYRPPMGPNTNNATSPAYEGMGSGWWRAVNWPYSPAAKAVNLQSGELVWQPGTVNRNVCWVRPPETGNLTQDARDQYFISYYGANYVL